MNFHQNRQFSFSANFRATQKFNNGCKFYYYKEYSMKVHVSNFRGEISLLQVLSRDRHKPKNIALFSENIILNAHVLTFIVTEIIN